MLSIPFVQSILGVAGALREPNFDHEQKKVNRFMVFLGSFTMKGNMTTKQQKKRVNHFFALDFFSSRVCVLRLGYLFKSIYDEAHQTMDPFRLKCFAIHCLIAITIINICICVVLCVCVIALQFFCFLA